MNNWQQLDHSGEECKAVRSVIACVGDKWSILIIVMLGEGSLRFNQIKSQINGISQRMLTLTLRALERDGVVLRTVYPTVPPKVEYALTPLGESLLEAVRPLNQWVRDNLKQIENCRAEYDALQAEIAGV